MVQGFNYAETKWIDASAHLHAGSPTVSKNRQVPPFMQKSPAIGHGCSCLGQAAVAVTKSEKKRYSSSLEYGIRVNIAVCRSFFPLIDIHANISLSLSLSVFVFYSFHFPRIVRLAPLRFSTAVYAPLCVHPRANKSTGVEALLSAVKENDIRIRDSGFHDPSWIRRRRDRVHFHFNRPARGSVFGMQMQRVARNPRTAAGENSRIREQER